jgi:hypothetical protein
VSLNLAEKYSSVVINQNQVVANPTDFSSGTSGSYRQEFYLPSDYRRGTESGELRYPDLSGFQLLVQITAGYAPQASFEYSLDYQVFGLGWVNVIQGVAIGAPTDGKVWMNAYFDEPIEVDQTKAGARWRINFQGRSTVAQPKDVPVTYANGEANVYGNRIVADLAPNVPWPFIYGGIPAFLYDDPSNSQVYFSYQQGIEKFWFASPNPLALPNHIRATLQDAASTPIIANGGEVSFCFRVLALTGDDGVDFLGNQYRSVVTRNKADSISTSLGADRDSYWLSKPNPSKFAIENLYFDVRKSASITYGRRNMVPNPSFEAGTSSWSDTTAVGAMTISDYWSTSGLKSLSWNGVSQTGTTFPGFQSDFIPVVAGRTYSARCDVNSITLPAGSGGVTLLLRFWNVGGFAIGDSAADFATGLGIDQLVVSGVAPVGAVNVTIIVFSISTAISSCRFYMDSVSMMEGPVGSLIYFDGDTDGHVWSGTAHNSVSFELLKPSIDDVSSVIDRLLIDPITPGAYFNAYYSTEGDPGATEDAWERKLWTRVPQTFRMERRETHVFPEPVKAKYIKIEFSHLQAQHYAPGDFQQAIRYKKHPKWVLDYFLARLSTDQVNPFLAERVRVIYDALDLAYNYYLDDLGQEPSTTIDVNNTSKIRVTDFLSNRTDASDRIDPTTLDRINLVMNTFRQQPALRGNPETLLAQYAHGTVNYNDDYPIEQNPPVSLNLPDVSSLNRDSVVIEQNYPVMFFYLTCRHAYREVEAKLSNDRAYFVGVRELAFLRDNYMSAFDTSTYIEPNADTLNIERNEFI